MGYFRPSQRTIEIYHKRLYIQEDLVCKNQGSMADNGKRDQLAASHLSMAQGNIVLSPSVPLVWPVLASPHSRQRCHVSRALNGRDHRAWAHVGNSYLSVPSLLFAQCWL